MAPAQKQNKKITRRSPNTAILNKTERDTLVLIKSSTPFVSALKRIDRILEKFDNISLSAKFRNGEYKSVKYVIIKGMGKSIQKTVSVALHYQSRNYQVDIYTGTVEVVDTVSSGEIIETREGPEEQTKNEIRKVSSVEARIWLKK